MKVLRAVENLLVVEPEPAETQIGGIVIPDTAAKKSQIGKVVSAGPLVEGIEFGDIVLYRPYSGAAVEVEGEPLLVLKDEDILGVLEDNLEGE